MHTARHNVYTLTAQFTGLGTAHDAYDSKVDKYESSLKSCLQERLKIFLFERNPAFQLTYISLWRQNSNTK